MKKVVALFYAAVEARLSLRKPNGCYLHNVHGKHEQHSETTHGVPEEAVLQAHTQLSALYQHRHNIRR